MPRLLVVSTIAETLEGFFLPHADHFHRRGWIVDAAASSLTTNRRCLQAYDRVFDVPWSRDPRDLRSQLHGLVAVRRLLERRRYDIVHMHTPVASLLTRMAIASLGRRSTQGRVHGTRLDFHPQGSVASNFVYAGLERLAGKWTDRLVVINNEDLRSARCDRSYRPARWCSSPVSGSTSMPTSLREIRGFEPASDLSWEFQSMHPSCS